MAACMSFPSKTDCMAQGALSYCQARGARHRASVLLLADVRCWLEMQRGIKQCSKACPDAFLAQLGAMQVIELAAVLPFLSLDVVERNSAWQHMRRQPACVHKRRMQGAGAGNSCAYCCARSCLDR